MFVKDKLRPPGCNPLSDEDRMPVLKVISGDSWTISAELFAANGGPASPDNSCVEFVLAENQFSPPLWTGEWMSGILPDANRPGLAHVSIPRELTKTLRRGSYMFSMRVSDRMRYSFSTQLEGYFLVEYMPTSDQHSIPYRDGTSERFLSGASGDEGSGGQSGQVDQADGAMARNIKTGLYHEIVVVEEEDTHEMTLAVARQGERIPSI